MEKIDFYIFRRIKGIKVQNFKEAIVVVLLGLALSSCAGYSTQFVCSDAKGASCTSMGRVHEMIQSGEIELYNEEQGKCKGKTCKKYKGVKTPYPRKKSMNVTYTDQ